MQWHRDACNRRGTGGLLPTPRAGRGPPGPPAGRPACSAPQTAQGEEQVGPHRARRDLLLGVPFPGTSSSKPSPPTLLPGSRESWWSRLKFRGCGNGSVCPLWRHKAFRRGDPADRPQSQVPNSIRCFHVARLKCSGTRTHVTGHVSIYQKKSFRKLFNLGGLRLWEGSGRPRMTRPAWGSWAVAAAATANPAGQWRAAPPGTSVARGPLAPHPRTEVSNGDGQMLRSRGRRAGSAFWRRR